MPPTLGNGKICYLEIPASDVRRSSDFYHAVFGWHLPSRFWVCARESPTARTHPGYAPFPGALWRSA